MATVVLSSSYDMSSADDWDWVVAVNTASQVFLVDSSGSSLHRQGFGGAFGYDNAGNVFGTVTSSSYYANNALVYTISGMNSDAHQMQYFVETFGNAQESNAFVLSGNDVVIGSSGNDVLMGYGGNDALDGGSGTDTASYSGSRASYTLARTASGWTVISTGDGTDTIANIERLKFSDGTLAWDVGSWQTAGVAYRLYQAAFARTPDTPGLNYWLDRMTNGQTAEQVAHNFIASAEFKSMYGTSPTHAQEVTAFYLHVLGRVPEQAGFDYWTGLLDSGMLTEAQILINFSESAENVALVGSAIQNGIWLGS